VVKIPQLQKLLRYICENGFEHHVAANFSTVAARYMRPRPVFRLGCSLAQSMSTVVAGVDFGTLSVRVSLVDSERGPLGSGTAEYPLHRKKEDPDFATQRHADHMDALVLAMHKAVAARA